MAGIYLTPNLLAQVGIFWEKLITIKMFRYHYQKRDFFRGFFRWEKLVKFCCQIVPWWEKVLRVSLTVDPSSSYPWDKRFFHTIIVLLITLIEYLQRQVLGCHHRFSIIMFFTIGCVWLKTPH